MGLFQKLYLLEYNSPGIFGDWYYMIILYVFINMLFGHSLEQVLEKKYLASHSIGFILTFPVMILIIFSFHALELLTGIESKFFYHLSFVILLIISLARIIKEKRKNASARTNKN
jgi:hypothetical protein